MLPKHTKAQHFSEYMVVFQVFIIATVLVITALGYLPQIKFGSLIHSSDQVLSIGPVGLLSAAIDECGGYTIRLRNNNPSPIAVVGVTLGGERVLNYTLTVPAGKDIAIQGSTGHRARAGTSYSLPITISILNQESGGVTDYTYKDPLYGGYVKFGPIGNVKYLHQGILDDICILGDVASVPDHVADRPKLSAAHAKSVLASSGYHALRFDGNASYAQLDPAFTASLPSFTLEITARINFTSNVTGIVYKPDSFYLTAKDRKLTFGIFDHGQEYTADSTYVPNATWIVVDAVYDGKALRLYVDGELNTGYVHQGKMDGSPYDVTIGDFTPGAGKNAVMDLGTLTLATTAFMPSEIERRSELLLGVYSPPKRP